MKIFFIVLSILFAVQCRSQNKAMSGTTVVAFICKDGIVLGADSRMSFATSSATPPYAYVSNFRKIFPLGNFQIALAGRGDVDGIPWQTIIQEYNATYKPLSTVEAEVIRYHEFMTDTLEISLVTISRTQWIVAGYEKDRPVVIFMDQDAYEGSYTVGHYSVIGHKCISLPTDTLTLSKLLTKDVIKLIENGIDTCSEKTVGPPVKIIAIKKNNVVTEVTHFQYQEWKGVKDYYQGILDKRIKVTYLYKWAQDSLQQKILREWNEF